MSGTRTKALKVLGTIGAMETFVENFPMSLLDFMHGPEYESVFDFLIQALEEANVSLYDIAAYIIKKIFGFDVKDFARNPESVYDAIASFDINEQSKFLNLLETAVKYIILALLAGIFSCSAIPMLPNRYMDKSKDKNWFRGEGNDSGQTIEERLDELTERVGYLDKVSLDEIRIPTGILNIFGQLNASPFSKAGKLYYAVDGGDVYYQKVQRTEYLTSGEETIEVPLYDKFAKISIVFGYGHADYIPSLVTEDEIEFLLSTPVQEDINIEITYSSDGEVTTVTKKIPRGQRRSEVFNITPNNPSKTFHQKEFIESITINGSPKGKMIGENTYVFLDRPSSEEVVKFWKSQGNDSLENDSLWGSTKDAGTKTVTLGSLFTEEKNVYEYVKVGGTYEDAYRVNYVPKNPDEESPEYIVCYEGLDPNTLYKTDDMNAFLWYIINRSCDLPQAEKNKNMWDSRMSAKELGTERKTAADWNRWYMSKPNDLHELHFVDSENNVKDELFPILQFRKGGSDLYLRFPAQRYFKPKAVDDENSFLKKLRMNSSIYKFNYDYLENIKIFKPRIILYGMFDALLNGAISALLDMKISVTRKETMNKLSNAIKRYIEAEDAEIEDCYFTFSNDDFSRMLEDMLLARYSATYNGGEVNRAAQHNIEDYLAQLDTINFSASADGDTTKIMKLVTDVSVSAGKEGSIDYGFDFDMNEGWWKRLLWAIALPIIEAIFSPQVLLLILINFELMGVVSTEDLFGTDQSAIIKLITNKIFSLVASIISFIKDKIAEALLDLYLEQIKPILLRYQIIKIKEQMEDWLKLLESIVYCLPTFKIKRDASIDEVNYADIINTQAIPENTQTNC